MLIRTKILKGLIQKATANKNAFLFSGTQSEWIKVYESESYNRVYAVSIMGISGLTYLAFNSIFALMVLACAPVHFGRMREQVLRLEINAKKNSLIKLTTTKLRSYREEIIDLEKKELKEFKTQNKNITLKFLYEENPLHKQKQLPKYKMPTITYNLNYEEKYKDNKDFLDLVERLKAMAKIKRLYM